jgi:hypothetical protein
MRKNDFTKRQTDVKKKILFSVEFGNIWQHNLFLISFVSTNVKSNRGVFEK